MLFKQSDWHEKKKFFVYADGRNAMKFEINKSKAVIARNEAERNDEAIQDQANRLLRRSSQDSKAPRNDDVSIMLPVLGYNSLIPPKDTDMGTMFHQIMQSFDIDSETRKLYEELKIF